MEIVTKNFLETALAHRNAECEVVFTSQKLIEMDDSEPIRRSLREQRRTLTSGLEVDLDFSCTTKRSGGNTDIEDLILAVLSTNGDEYKQQLADNADFFIQYNQRVEQVITNPAIVAPEKPKSGKGKTIGTVFGFLGCMMLFAIALFVVRARRSTGTVAQRVSDEDENEFYEMRPDRALTVINEDENETYDLNAISTVGNDNGLKSNPHQPEPPKEVKNQKLGMMTEAIKSSKNKSKSVNKVSVDKRFIRTICFFRTFDSPLRLTIVFCSLRRKMKEQILSFLISLKRL